MGDNHTSRAERMLDAGQPDAPCGWNGVAQHLHTAGYRTIVPFLRGSSPM